MQREQNLRSPMDKQLKATQVLPWPRGDLPWQGPPRTIDRFRREARWFPAGATASAGENKGSSSREVAAISFAVGVRSLWHVRTLLLRWLGLAGRVPISAHP